MHTANKKEAEWNRLSKPNARTDTHPTQKNRATERRTEDRHSTPDKQMYRAYNVIHDVHIKCTVES